MCLSHLTSHGATRRLEPFGPLLLASLAALSVLTAGLSGHIWQHVTAAILQLPEQPGQLQPVSAYVTCRLAVPAELFPGGRNNGAHRAGGVNAQEPCPTASLMHSQAPCLGLPYKPHALRSYGSAGRPFLFKSQETTTHPCGGTLVHS